jgi:hypothetical protein
MARRSEAEIVADLKKRIREKQERAARKSNESIGHLDATREALRVYGESPAFSEEDRELFRAAGYTLQKMSEQFLEDWIAKHG